MNPVLVKLIIGGAIALAQCVGKSRPNYNYHNCTVNNINSNNSNCQWEVNTNNNCYNKKEHLKVVTLPNGEKRCIFVR